MSTEMSLRLCSRAPRIRIAFELILNCPLALLLLLPTARIIGSNRLSYGFRSGWESARPAAVSLRRTRPGGSAKGQAGWPEAGFGRSNAPSQGIGNLSLAWRVPLRESVQYCGLTRRTHDAGPERRGIGRRERAASAARDGAGGTVRRAGPGRAVPRLDH